MKVGNPQFACCLACCAGVRVDFHAYCLPILQLSQIQRNCPQGVYFYVLNIIKPPNSTPCQTDTEPVCFAPSISWWSPECQASIPRQISTSTMVTNYLMNFSLVLWKYWKSCWKGNKFPNKEAKQKIKKDKHDTFGSHTFMFLFQ